MALLDKKPKKQKSSMTRRERKVDEMYKSHPEWAAEDGYTGPKKMKTGGAKKPLMKAQDGRIIKSNKVRTADLNTFGPSEASVSKTKRDGSTVTKYVKTNQGDVPST